MSLIDTNIKTLRKLRNLSQESLADEMSIQRARLASYEEGRCEPPYDLLIKFADYFHVAIDALLRANLSKTKPEDLMKVGENRILFPIMVDKDGNDLVEVVPIKAQAGYLNGYADPEYIESLQHMNFPFLPVGKHRAFPIKGDSMPPLADGSFVIGKYMESLKEMRDGQTYILVTKDEGIVFKIVYPAIKTKRKLLLKSLNAEYEPYEINISDVVEMWKFTNYISAELPEADISQDDLRNTVYQLGKDVKEIKKALKTV